MPSCTILHGDVLDRLSDIDPSSIDMAYLDPPFAIKFDDVHSWNSYMGYEPNPLFGSAPNRLARYLTWFDLVLRGVQATLTDTATLWIHLDPNAAPYVRVLADSIFGYESFRNEIVWTYAGAKSGKRDFPRKHDTILRYCISTKEWVFNGDDIKVPFKAEYAKNFRRVDSDGRSYFDLITAGKTRRYYLDTGELPWDYWTDINAGQQMSKSQRVGYPTQKPVELIDRIVKVSTTVDQTVLDAFCGSGTTAVSALRNGRNYVGIEQSADAISLASKRIESVDGEVPQASLVR